MRRKDFAYHLPANLIAQFPSAERGDSRLLCLDGAQGTWVDRHFSELPEILQAGDLLVFNDTRVIPARLFGHKDSGGRVEVMVERILDDQRILAQLKASKKPRTGSRILLDQGFELKVKTQQGDMFVLALNSDSNISRILADLGHIPLPPYIQRPDTEMDVERYQTVYASQSGAVAAPTAGLHFTNEILQLFSDRGIETAYVTLHVGAGTFQPVRTEMIEDHKMHSEYLEVTENVCKKVNETKKNDGRIIAVGTTSVRCLETATYSGRLQPFQGETDIFIYPGFKFQTVDALITNFHLPESTLLMLVCAFSGHLNIMRAYQHAMDNEYRFYSYGDAMFLTKGCDSS